MPTSGITRNRSEFSETTSLPCADLKLSLDRDLPLQYPASSRRVSLRITVSIATHLVNGANIDSPTEARRLGLLGKLRHSFTT